MSAKGEQQAVAVGNRLATTTVDLLLCSTLIRAQRTAELIGNHHELTPLAEHWLNERNCGVLEGLTKAEMKESHPDVRKAYKRRDLDLAIEGGGETSLQFHKRVAAGMATLAGDISPSGNNDNSNKTVVAVCHGGTMREAFNYVFNTSQNGNNLRCRNCSISIFHYQRTLWSMETWGDSSHL